MGTYTTKNNEEMIDVIVEDAYDITINNEYVMHLEATEEEDELSVLNHVTFIKYLKIKGIKFEIF